MTGREREWYRWWINELRGTRFLELQVAQAKNAIHEHQAAIALYEEHLEEIAAAKKRWSEEVNAS